MSLLGYDVWRISRALRLSPELFVLAHDQPEPANDGFLLAPDGWPQGLALDKRGEFAPGQPCVFLVDLGGGHANCGIYEHRPAVCRTYPMAIRAATTRVRDDALCPAGSWSTEQVAQPGWGGDLQRYHEHWNVYVGVVMRWNERVRASPPGASFTVPDFLCYVVNTYDGLAAGGSMEPHPCLAAPTGPATLVSSRVRTGQERAENVRKLNPLHGSAPETESAVSPLGPRENRGRWFG